MKSIMDQPRYWFVTNLQPAMQTLLVIEYTGHKPLEEHYRDW